jgi:hypothetical protein
VKTDRVVAVIVQRDPAMPADQLTKTLRALCREHLAPYEVPRAFQFVEELPRNALGKLQKFRLQSDDGGPDGNDVEEAVESGDASEKRRTPMRTESVHERHGKHEESSPVN